MNLGDISDLNRYDEFSDSRTTILKSTQVIIIIIGVIVLLLCLFNIWTYLLKHKKYRDVSILLFYVNALADILMMMIRTYFVPVRNYCKLTMIILNYGIPLLNLNLGIC